MESPEQGEEGSRQGALRLKVQDSRKVKNKGYIDLHHEHYLLECISAESNVDLTIDSIRQALKKPGILKLLCEKIVASCFIPERSLRLNRKFTPSFAQQLHRQIGNELINNAGQYRTRHVMAAQENHVYIALDLIEDKMNELFCQCRQKFGRTDLQLEKKRKSSKIAFELPLIKIHSARYQEPFNPSALTTFILECVYKTSYNICVVMDIDIQD
ncbi:764_t:CDS:2 [Scutellospora calospora]|uniref:764_t:CDS:1 n=1 Tax=Scutellospora calospora TaxID=85575 RepID=A0ACA9L6L7_9GLOM|nr:764_t:CDS:2 [Scutellospora calospora]